MSQRTNSSQENSPWSENRPRSSNPRKSFAVQRRRNRDLYAKRRLGVLRPSGHQSRRIRPERGPRGRARSPLAYGVRGLARVRQEYAPPTTPRRLEAHRPIRSRPTIRAPLGLEAARLSFRDPTQVSVDRAGNCVETNINYTMQQEDRIIIASAAITVTLPPEPLTGNPVWICADNGAVTVTGPIQGGNQRLPKASLAASRIRR